MAKNKIYVIAGHTVINGKGTGAQSKFGDEAVEAVKVRDAVVSLLQKRGLNALRDCDKTSLNGVIDWLRKAVGAIDIVCDIHFNAGGPSATGVEVFVDDTSTDTERRLAHALTDTIASTLGIRNRGVKLESVTRHKTLGIISGPSAAINVLVEVCFLTSAGDMESYRKNFDPMCRGIADILARYSESV